VIPHNCLLAFIYRLIYILPIIRKGKLVFEICIVICAGLVFGSFISCASYRLPLELDVVKKSSYCPTCNTVLKARDLVPVFSWLFSGGKCSHCSTKISFRYPMIELVTAGLFLFIYAKYGVTAQALILALMAVMLMIMIVADLEHFIIPDSVHVVLFPLGFMWHYINGTLSEDIVWSFGVMAGLALLLHHGYSKLRGRTMLGYGDVKFFAVVGVWLPLMSVPIFLFMSGILGVMLGLVWRLAGRGVVFPFGPALAVSLFFCIVYPELSNALLFMK
jgi:leader peptidase (prepilin peptidase) / N-methyltransferase